MCIHSEFLNCYSCRYHRSAMAEILHIQLKIPLHESKREEEKEWLPQIYIYIYTSSINHWHLRLPSLLSSNKDKLSASHSSLFLLLSKLLWHLISSFSSSSSFFFYDTRDVVLQMTLIRKRERERESVHACIRRV